MKKHRLTQREREMILEAAREFVTRIVDAKLKWPATREKFEKHVIECIDAACPPADLDVLRRYDHARLQDTVYISAGGRGDWEKLNLTEQKLMHGYNVHNIDQAKLERFKDAKEARDAIISDRMKDYRALINGARTLEDVVDVWPEAERFRPAEACTAISIVTPELAARVACDVKAAARLKGE